MNFTLGQRISTLRKQNELTQDALAEKLGISPQAVSKWENDQTCPDITLLPKLSKVLGVTVDELLTGENTETMPETRLVPLEERKDINDMMFRIVMESSDGTTVRVNFPVKLMQIAVDTGIAIAQVSGNDSLKNIDVGKLLEMVQQGVVGNLMEVETSEGDTIRIFVE